MEEYLKQINRYLPMQFVDEEANEFIKYLSEAYLENIEKEKYQFAFTAFHMLNMIFIYKTKWFLKEQQNLEIQRSLQNYIQQHRGTIINTLFDLSIIPEKKSLEALLQALSFHANDVGICNNLVDIRNNCSHASGRIYYKTQAKIEHYIKEEIEFMEKIQKKLKHESKKFLKKFLEENWHKTFISGDFKNLFSEKYFSLKDLELISTLDLSLLRKKSNNEKNIKQKIIYLLLVFEIQNRIDSEENIFLERLPILMINLTETIKVRKGKEKDEYEININEIVEESLMPIIGNFSDEDRKKAEEILKLGENK